MMHNNKNLCVRLVTKLAALLLVGSLTACATPQPNIDIPTSPPPVVKLTHQPRVALVLGCGGVRGYAHLGVLQALEEAHIPVDVLVGSSAGSMVGSLYADNNSFQETYDIMMPAGFWDYADISNISGSGGIINGYQLERFLLNHMHARTFNQLQKKLIIATSDIKSGKVYAIESGPIAPAVVASSAIPGAVKPVKLYGHNLIDGGVLSPVPVELARKLHPRLIIAVDLSETKERAMPKTAYEVLNSAIYLMGQQLTQSSLKGADVVISPKVGDVSIFDVGKKRDIYLAGLAAARKQIPLIKQLLGTKHIH